MKGYKDEAVAKVESDLKRCRELSVLISQEEQEVKKIKEAYKTIKSVDELNEIDIVIIEDLVIPHESKITKYSKERDKLINKYFSKIVKLKQREKDIILRYYIDNICTKIIANEIKIEQRQVVYSKKKALEKLAQE
jgi:DNA-directed RNA polymerase specialized sigma subunit